MGGRGQGAAWHCSGRPCDPFPPCDGKRARKRPQNLEKQVTETHPAARSRSWRANLAVRGVLSIAQNLSGLPLIVGGYLYNDIMTQEWFGLT